MTQKQPYETLYYLIVTPSVLMYNHNIVLKMEHEDKHLIQMSVLNMGGFGGKDTPFRFTPQRIHLGKDHELFEDGDIHRHMYLQNLSSSETDEQPNVSEFGCHISGCCQRFRSVEEYEHHYNSLHRHVCSACRRSFPSARLLDVHIEEWHDAMFDILSQTLKSCCGLKFRTSKRRKDHLIQIHKYPPDFRFDKTKREHRSVVPSYNKLFIPMYVIGVTMTLCISTGKSRNLRRGSRPAVRR
uniref:Zinc finger protein 511 n=1 Tax=Gadus morhua TaxID=8049 RepID=A0A8C4ZYT0_GADMO